MSRILKIQLRKTNDPSPIYSHINLDEVAVSDLTLVTTEEDIRQTEQVGNVIFDRDGRIDVTLRHGPVIRNTEDVETDEGESAPDPKSLDALIGSSDYDIATGLESFTMNEARLLGRESSDRIRDLEAQIKEIHRVQQYIKSVAENVVGATQPRTEPF